MKIIQNHINQKNQSSDKKAVGSLHHQRGETPYEIRKC